MKTLNLFVSLVAAAALFAGCRGPEEKALLRLDATLLQKERFDRNLEQHALLFRSNLKKARTDSLAFAAAEMLYDTYRHVSIDSAEHYLGIMESKAGTKAQKAAVAGYREDLDADVLPVPPEERTISALAEAAEIDLKASRRDYVSLYELALLLYERKDYVRADRYVERNFLDAMEGRFNIRFFNSGNAYRKIAEARRSVDRRRVWMLIGGGILLIILSILCISLHRQSRRQKSKIMTLQGTHARTVTRLREDLADADAKIHDDGQALAEASRVKEQLLFRVMDLSAGALNGTSSKKSAAFYRAFDEAFLNAFPNFVDGVNDLLREDARFVGTVPLRTELRILAMIRLGMTESGRIAEFLGMAPPTVYSYRTRMRNAASGPKDEFEKRVKKI